MKVEEVHACSFVEWFADFQEWMDDSVVLPLGNQLVAYLSEDGLFLPEECPIPNLNPSLLTDDISYCCEQPSSSLSNSDEVKFFIDKTNDVIKMLGGSVFVKLNWSSPKDAVWIASGHTLKCQNAVDALLLLKSSDFVVHDLVEPFDQCEDDISRSTCTTTAVQYNLVLRQWKDIKPSSEFRCFVRSSHLIAISQRHDSSYFDCLKYQKSSIYSKIKHFHQSNVKSRFDLENYVFDIYLDDTNHVVLVDFNPWGTVTDSLLFNWKELNSSEFPSSDQAEFRIVENSSIQPNPFQYHAMPYEFYSLSTGQDCNVLSDFLNLRIQEQNDEQSSEDENSVNNLEDIDE